MAPGFGSSPRHIRRRISGYVAADVTPVMGQQTSKDVEVFFSEALSPMYHFVAFSRNGMGRLPKGVCTHSKAIEMINKQTKPDDQRSRKKHFCVKSRVVCNAG